MTKPKTTKPASPWQPIREAPKDGTHISEINRRKHGPFTLAEAVASGRPFRRKAWGDDPSFCRLDKDCSSSWFDFGWQTDCIDPDDITATDYELKDGGGDAS